MKERKRKLHIDKIQDSEGEPLVRKVRLGKKLLGSSSNNFKMKVFKGNFFVGKYPPYHFRRRK